MNLCSNANFGFDNRFKKTPILTEIKDIDTTEEKKEIETKVQVAKKVKTK